MKLFLIIYNNNFLQDKDGNLQPTAGKGEDCAMMYKDDQYYFHSQNCDAMGSPLCQADPIEQD